MQMPKPTEADKERFRSIVPDDARVEVKPMFGNLGAFVNGNIFMGLFGATIGVKLAPADAERLRAAGGGPFGPEERPMSGWVTLPQATIGTADGGRWVSAALDHVGAMIGVKLAPAEAERLRAAGGGPFGPEERPMSGWVTLPQAMIGTADGGRWVSAALDYVGALPPKAPKG